MVSRSPQDWKKPFLGGAGRMGLVFVVLSSLLLLSALPLGFWRISDIRPAFILMAVFYWAVFYPHLLPPSTAFVLGVFLDLLGGWPLGLNALTLVLVQWMVRGQRKFLLGQRFVVLWAAFTLVAFLTGILQWGVFCLFYWELFAVKSVFVSAGLSGLIFPLVALPLQAAGRALSVP